MSKTTKPEIFIIESLPFDNPHDGKILADVLRIAGKNPIYYSCNTSEEFLQGLYIFKATKYRFLHISCHGTSDSVCFANGELLDYYAFAKLFEKIPVSVSRIFFSACELGNPNISEQIMRSNKSFYSFIGPCKPISFGNALAIWSAFYLSMFDVSTNSMKDSMILDKLTKIIQVFNADFHVSRYEPSQKEIWHYQLLASPALYQKTPFH